MARWMVMAVLLAMGLALPAWAGDREDCERAGTCPGGTCRDNAETPLKTEPARVAAACRRLADQGDAAAELHLGSVYYSGQGMAQDYTEAAKWWRKAAEQGNAAAQFNLGYLYDYGMGVPANLAVAMAWYRKAAEQGNPYAQTTLAAKYYDGRIIPQNYAEAVKWWRKAAEQGHGQAQYNLGKMYADGLGVPQDYVQAHMWFNLAVVAGGVFGALDARASVAAKMTPAQIDQAQALATAWKPNREPWMDYPVAPDAPPSGSPP